MKRETLFLLEIPQVDGRVYVLTSSWQTNDSQLARSSKFPIVLNRLLELAADVQELSPRYHVGDPIALRTSKDAQQMMLPGQQKIQLAAAENTFTETISPGVYEVSSPTEKTQPQKFAVNIPADESRTAPLPLERLESLGITLTNSETVAQKEAQERQLRAGELEQQQKLWRWLILAAMLLAFVETLWAGRLARRMS